MDKETFKSFRNQVKNLCLTSGDKRLVEVFYKMADAYSHRFFDFIRSREGKVAADELGDPKVYDALVLLDMLQRHVGEGATGEGDAWGKIVSYLSSKPQYIPYVDYLKVFANLKGNDEFIDIFEKYPILTGKWTDFHDIDDVSIDLVRQNLDYLEDAYLDFSGVSEEEKDDKKNKNNKGFQAMLNLFYYIYERFVSDMSIAFEEAGNAEMAQLIRSGNFLHNPHKVSETIGMDVANVGVINQLLGSVIPKMNINKEKFAQTYDQLKKEIFSFSMPNQYQGINRQENEYGIKPVYYQDKEALSKAIFMKLADIASGEEASEGSPVVPETTVPETTVPEEGVPEPEVEQPQFQEFTPNVSEWTNPDVVGMVSALLYIMYDHLTKRKANFR
jgi:hypothetical protein